MAPASSSPLQAMQDMTFDFSTYGQPMTYGQPATRGPEISYKSEGSRGSPDEMQMGTLNDPLHTTGGTVDLLEKQELAEIEAAKHAQPTEQGMNDQIQKLVQGQRAIFEQFQALQDHLTQNAQDIE